DGADEAGRPAGREQLLRIGAGAGGAGDRELHLEAAVRRARGAAVAPAGGVSLGGVEELVDGGDGAVHGMFLSLGWGGREERGTRTPAPGGCRRSRARPTGR